MKPNSPNGSGSMPDGEQFGDGAASSTESGEESPGAVMMPNDGGEAFAPGERGMPGLGKRSTQGGMPGGGMDGDKGGREFDMPGGAMDKEGAGGMRADAGNGGQGGGDAYQGDGTGIESPRVS